MCERTATHLKTHCPSRLRLSSLNLFLRSVFTRPRVFTMTRVFARPVFGKRLRPCVFATTRTFARPVFGRCFLTRTWLHPAKHLGQGSARARVLAVCLRLAARQVSADTQVSLQTVLRNLSPRPHLSSKCVFGPRAICAHPKRPQSIM